jgi:hypothetical protein
MKANAIPLVEQKKVADHLDGLPPITYLMQSWTTDQGQRYLECREFFQLLKDSLQSFFAGRPFRPLKQNSKPRTELVLSVQDTYLAGYTVIQYGWYEAIDAYKQRIGSSIQETLNIHCPGDVIVVDLTHFADTFMIEAFLPYYSFTPARYRQLEKNGILAQKHLGNAQSCLRQGEDWRKELRQGLDYTDAWIKESNALHPVRGTGILDDLIYLCRNTKDKRLKKYIKEYHKKQDDCGNLIKLHPRHKLRGYQWREGVKTQINHGGSRL